MLRYAQMEKKDCKCVELIREKFSDLNNKMNVQIVRKLVDNLFEKNVLSLEEMNSVLDGTNSHKVARTLVIMIMQKGKESCHYFLQLLQTYDEFLFRDVFGPIFSERKGTFEHLMKVEQTDDILEKEFDKLEKNLKRYYQSPGFQNFYPLGEVTDIDIIFNLETTFTDPFIWVKDIYNRRKEKMKFDDMLCKLESPCIIEGEAGKGKSTMLKRIAVLWASERCQQLLEYKLVFFVTLRGTSEGLYETLSDQLFAFTYNWNKVTFLQRIQQLGKKILFLLDGYDEFNSERCREIDDLIKKNYIYNSTVIVSTRTESLGEVRRYGALIVETSDFTLESAKTLIQKVLDDKEANGLLIQLDASDFMKNLMKTPLFLVIACALRMGENNFQMNTQTALFCTLYELMIDRGHNKIKDIKENIVEDNIYLCGDLALNGLFDHQYEFQNEHLTNIKEDILLKIGLLNKYTANKRKPGYRFFHTSFQEYIAGRRLSQLLSSDKTVHVGERFLNKLQTIYDVTNRYKNLLLYTCGSSKTATQQVICHIRNLCRDEMNETSSDFVEFGINLFYESATKKEMNAEFESIFSHKTLHISMHNVGSHHFEFFEHLPGCLSALQLVKLDLFSKKSNVLVEDGDVKSPGDMNELKPQTYISKKIVSLFYDWTQALQTLEVTIKKFDHLNKYDVKFLGKICCCANHLRLKISSSAGITGNLTRVVDNCKRMKELIINNTPLSIEDEAQIVEMTNIKTLGISNMDNEHQQVILDGLHKLVEIETLTLHNISMTEKDGEVLANGISHLKKLEVLKLSDLPNIGSSMDHIVQSISHCDNIKEIHLINCCLTSQTLISLSNSLKKFKNLEILDLSDNLLEDDGTLSLEALGQTLTHLPSLTTLLLPGGRHVKSCLVTLLNHLKGLARLSKLSFRRWNMTDDNVIKLAEYFPTSFGQLSILDLSYNCADNDGWIFLIQALRNLKNLTHFDLSTEEIFIPIGDVVHNLCRAVEFLPCLCSMQLDNWELDNIDIGKMKNQKLIHREGKAHEHFFLVEKN